VRDPERDVDARRVVEADHRSEGPTESSAWFKKWYGVVADDSKTSPSIESMQSPSSTAAA